MVTRHLIYRVYTVQYNVTGLLKDDSLIHLTNAWTSQYVSVARKGRDPKSVVCQSLELPYKLRQVRSTIQNLQVFQVPKLMKVQEILLWYMLVSNFETFQLWK